MTTPKPATLTDVRKAETVVRRMRQRVETQRRRLVAEEAALADALNAHQAVVERYQGDLRQGG